MNQVIRHKQQGAMLLEALVGILVFSIGILALLGMQALSMQATIDAKYRTEASFLANEIIGVMWVDRAAIADYDTTTGAGTLQRTAWINRVVAILPNATGANAPTIAIAGRQATVTVRWMRPGETAGNRHEVVAHINDPS
jgi:type IV pilus assembly protein PilV